MRRGRGSRPITRAEAKAGLRPRACMHVNARGRRPRGIYMHACARPLYACMSEACIFVTKRP
eukprot:364298-Chlamydomonas_euryale.AAC.13